MVDHCLAYSSWFHMYIHDPLQHLHGTNIALSRFFNHFQIIFCSQCGFLLFQDAILMAGDQHVFENEKRAVLRASEIWSEELKKPLRWTELRWKERCWKQHNFSYIHLESWWIRQVVFDHRVEYKSFYSLRRHPFFSMISPNRLFIDFLRTDNPIFRISISGIWYD